MSLTLIRDTKVLFSLIPYLTALCTLFTISDLSKRLLHPSSLFHREIERQAIAAKAEQEVGKETWCWWQQQQCSKDYLTKSPLNVLLLLHTWEIAQNLDPFRHTYTHGGSALCHQGVDFVQMYSKGRIFPNNLL